MRYTFILILLLIISFSCKTTLELRDISNENISNDSSLSWVDSSIVALVLPYREALEVDMKKVLVISNEELAKAKPESKLTNLMADYLLQSGVDYCRLARLNIVPDMAFMNYGGLRVALPRGEITVGNVFELMPFENEMVLLKLSGPVMQQFMQKVAARGGDGVAGIRLGIKDGHIGQLEIDGAPFDPKRDYWVVTNDYIAEGGDSMSMLLNHKESIATGIKLRDLIIERFKAEHDAGRRIKVVLDGRIYYE
ncbi:5'-nucleotidase [uncultured Sunxiuqinia sp.]|uniref:5'-nucleotidase C-terminal domain-containing protein n=1 Tax=uncultured Sunxiuqinia sp. TaxID=1573825 RepID=UPI00260ED56E|nr:5'-nucleotidase [uncultured Sunxiuqinia sp.]